MTPSGYDFFTHAPHMQYALIRTSYHHHPQFLDQMLPKLNALNAENKNIKTTNKINIYADFPSFICGYQRNKKKCFQTFKISVGQNNLGANILWPPFWYHFWSRHIWISHPSLNNPPQCTGSLQCRHNFVKVYFPEQPWTTWSLAPSSPNKKSFIWLMLCPYIL